MDNYIQIQEIIKNAISNLKQYCFDEIKFELCVGIQIYRALMQDPDNFIEYDGKAFYCTIPVIVRGDIGDRDFTLYVKDSIKFDKEI